MKLINHIKRTQADGISNFTGDIIFYDEDGNAVCDSTLPIPPYYRDRLCEQFNKYNITTNFTAKVHYMHDEHEQKFFTKPSNDSTFLDFTEALSFFIDYLNDMPAGVQEVTDSFFQALSGDDEKTVCIDVLICRLYHEHDNPNLVRDLLNYGMQKPKHSY